MNINFKRLVIFCSLLLIFLPSCKEEKEEKKDDVTDSFAITYAIKRTLAHDETAYTQGLVFDGNQLYESTGQDGSWIAKVDLETGKHDKKVVLPDNYFGEGIAVLNNKIYQLTWQNRQGFVYDKHSFQQINKFSYNFEGWGITTNGKELIVSDGSNKLFFLDTLEFKVSKILSVTDHGYNVDRLNELELVGNYVWANQWQTDYIYKIDLATGIVVGKADFSSLSNEIKGENNQAEVLNGIAFNKQTKDFLITGKLWHKAFVVQMKYD